MRANGSSPPPDVLAHVEVHLWATGTPPGIMPPVFRGSFSAASSAVEGDARRRGGLAQREVGPAAVIDAHLLHGLERAGVLVGDILHRRVGRDTGSWVMALLLHVLLLLEAGWRQSL